MNKAQFKKARELKIISKQMHFLKGLNENDYYRATIFGDLANAKGILELLIILFLIDQIKYHTNYKKFKMWRRDSFRLIASVLTTENFRCSKSMVEYVWKKVKNHLFNVKEIFILNKQNKKIKVGEDISLNKLCSLYDEVSDNAKDITKLDFNKMYFLNKKGQERKLFIFRTKIYKKFIISVNNLKIFKNQFSLKEILVQQLEKLKQIEQVLKTQINII